MADACYRIPFNAWSFKGATCESTEASHEGGRRGAEGQFPFGETSAYADLGIHIRGFHVKGRFAGNDHMDAARAFRRVLESPGPGMLVHPTYGAVRAACKKFKFHDKTLEGYGVTEVDCEFVEAPAWLGTAIGLSLAGIDATGVVSAVQSVFSGAYNFSGPLASAGSPIGQMITVINAATSAVGAVSRAFDAAAGLSSDGTVWRISEDLRTVSSSVSGPSLMASPSTAWQAISNGIEAVTVYGRSTEVTIDSLRSTANWGTTWKTTTTGAALAAETAVVAAMRTLSGVALARTIIGSAAATKQAACRQYGMALTVLQEERFAARQAGQTELFQALDAYIVEAQQAMLTRVFGAPQIVSYDFGGPVWAVVAAHEIYRDARRSPGIEAMNEQSFPWALGPEVAAASPSAAANRVN